jgi:membrane associated rhomboid family serine protease
MLESLRRSVEEIAMFILGDEGHYHGRFPWVTTSLVFVNVLLYTMQCFLGEPFTNGFSLVPAEITEFRDLTRVEYAKVNVPVGTRRGHDRRGAETLYSPINVPINHYPGPFPIFLTFLTAMFLHGGLLHLIGNMWFLLVFGRNVECALGHGRFLVFYLSCGIVAGAAHIASDPHSVIPCLGASGAISGVLGAYVAIHPLNKVKVWLGWFFGVVDVPALVVIGIWFLFQYLAVCRSLDNPQLPNRVAYWAHIGGFLSGLAFIWGTVLYLRRQVAQMARAEVASEPSAAAAALPDPFASFLPPPLRSQERDARRVT